MSCQEISNIVFEYKENFSDYHFKTVMDNLKVLHQKIERTQVIDNISSEEELTQQYFKHFFYHSSACNNCFYAFYNEHDYTIWVSFEHRSHQFKINDQFFYSKTFDVLERSIQVSYARIIKMMRKYTIIEVYGEKKKISNLTLAKCFFFPYINLG